MKQKKIAGLKHVNFFGHNNQLRASMIAALIIMIAASSSTGAEAAAISRPGKAEGPTKI